MSDRTLAETQARLDAARWWPRGRIKWEISQDVVSKDRAFQRVCRAGRVLGIPPHAWRARHTQTHWAYETATRRDLDAQEAAMSRRGTAFPTEVEE